MFIVRHCSTVIWTFFIECRFPATMVGSAGKPNQRFLAGTILEHLYDKRELVG
jgi:hypothetical protein